MEDQDYNALLDTDAAIQPYLDVLKDVGDAGTIRTMILKVLSDPKVFCGFDQILALCRDERQLLKDEKMIATLELFSYGTYDDYCNGSGSGKFLPLNETQIFKLRQLTVLTCVQQALQESTSISYQVLEQALQCPLEPILIPCLYARILNGKLCQKSKRFFWTTVPPCISRDVPLTAAAAAAAASTTAAVTSNLDVMLTTLIQLQQRLQSTQIDLQDSHSYVSEKLEQSNSYWKMVKERSKKAQAQAKNRSAWSSGGGASGSDGAAAAAAAMSGIGGGPGGQPSSGGTATSNRRSSTSRQSKRSRGGLGGSFTEPFQRY